MEILVNFWRNTYSKVKVTNKMNFSCSMGRGKNIKELKKYWLINFGNIFNYKWKEQNKKCTNNHLRFSSVSLSMVLLPRDSVTGNRKTKGSYLKQENFFGELLVFFSATTFMLPLKLCLEHINLLFPSLKLQNFWIASSYILLWQCC